MPNIHFLPVNLPTVGVTVILNLEAPPGFVVLESDLQEQKWNASWNGSSFCARKEKERKEKEKERKPC
jgi:hypothetical protein